MINVNSVVNYKNSAVSSRNRDLLTQDNPQLLMDDVI